LPKILLITNTKVQNGEFGQNYHLILSSIMKFCLVLQNFA
jgi:hypothetical protein